MIAVSLWWLVLIDIRGGCAEQAAGWVVPYRILDHILAVVDRSNEIVALLDGTRLLLINVQ